LASNTKEYVGKVFVLQNQFNFIVEKKNYVLKLISKIFVRYLFQKNNILMKVLKRR